MSGTSIEQIKEKIDIVEFLKGYITVTPAGRNFKANCPFHKEKTPSFMISPDRQTWHCFGCSLHGDAFSFLMRYENLEFGEALKILAEKTGVELARTNPADYKFSGLLYELNEKAKNFFKSQLAGALPAREYLKARGLQEGTIEEFEIGWAPNAPEDLAMHFLKQKYAAEDVMRAGLVLKTERGMTIDRFRGRIMFPIHNHLGKVVGFTGRILPALDTGQTGKYVNSPETPIFNKSKLLYGFWKSKDSIREKSSAFVVEGQMDFLMSFQAGVRNAVASSGTAFTTDHLRALRRLAEELVFCFDNDEAGWAAGERAIDMAQAADFGVKLATLSGAKDPAEVAAQNPDALVQMVKAAEPAMRVYVKRYIPGGSFNLTDRANLKNLRIVLSKIKSLASPAGRDSWLRELGHYSGVREAVLQEEMEGVSASSQSMTQEVEPIAAQQEQQEPAIKLSRLEFLAEQMLGAALATQRFAEIPREVLPQHYGVILQAMETGERSLADAFHDQVLERIMLQQQDADMEELKKQFVAEWRRLRKDELTRAIRQAEAAGDEALAGEKMEELKALLAESKQK